MKKQMCIMIALLALSAAAASAGQNPGTEPGAPALETEESARKKIEAIRISRLTEALNLDEKTAAKFIPAIAALELKRRTAMQEHRHAMMELRRLVQGPGADSSRLKDAIDKFAASRREMMKLREKEFDTAREYLTAEQLARYLLFQQDFLQEVRDMVSGLPGGRPGMRGFGPGPGRGPGFGPPGSRVPQDR